MTCTRCKTELKHYCPTCWTGFSSPTKCRIWAIDGNWLTRLYWHADEENVPGRIKEWIDRTFSRFPSDRIICGWDSPNNYRKQILPEYKAQREDRKKSLETAQWETADMMAQSGIDNRMVDQMEADDIMASIAAQNDGQTVLVSGDQDIWQCLEDGYVSVYRKRKDGWSFMTATMFVQNFGFLPSRFIDYKILVGDPSDNLTGATGIGDKTAKDMLKAKSLREILAFPDEYTEKRAQSLRELLPREPDLRRVIQLNTKLPVL